MFTPSLYGTYQHHNLIPASLLLHPSFTAFTPDFVMLLSDEAATRYLAGVGLQVIAERKQKKKQNQCTQVQKTHCVNTAMCQEIDPKQR